MFAIVAAVLFGFALVFQLADLAFGQLDAAVLISAGLLALAAQFISVGGAGRWRAPWSRRRR